jgi:hypothetical protein
MQTFKIRKESFKEMNVLEIRLTQTWFFAQILINDWIGSMYILQPDVWF